MSGETDKKYDRIIQQAIDSMNNVKAPIEDYRAALRVAIAEFQIALTASLGSS